MSRSAPRPAARTFWLLVAMMALATVLLGVLPSQASAYRFSTTMRYYSLTSWEANGGEAAEFKNQEEPASEQVPCGGGGSGAGYQRITYVTPARPLVFTNVTFRGRRVLDNLPLLSRSSVTATITRQGRFAGCAPRPSYGCGTRGYRLTVLPVWGAGGSLGSGRLQMHSVNLQGEQGPFDKMPDYVKTCPYPSHWYSASGSGIPLPEEDGDQDIDLADQASRARAFGTVVSRRVPILSEAQIRNTRLRTIRISERLTIRWRFDSDGQPVERSFGDKVPLTGISVFRIDWLLRRTG